MRALFCECPLRTLSVQLSHSFSKYRSKSSGTPNLPISRRVPALKSSELFSLSTQPVTEIIACISFGRLMSLSAKGDIRRHKLTKCISSGFPFEIPLFKDHRENSYFGRNSFGTFRRSPSDQLEPSGATPKCRVMSPSCRVSAVMVRYAYASFSLEFISWPSRVPGLYLISAPWWSRCARKPPLSNRTNLSQWC